MKSIIKMKGGIANPKVKREPVVPREVLWTFIKDYKLQTAEDVQNALKDIFADTFQEKLESKLDLTLAYESTSMRTRTSKSDLTGIIKKRSAVNMAMS